MLVDGHGLIHDAVRALIDSVEDITLIGAASTTTAGFKLARDAKPDVAIIELSRADPSGHTLANRMIREIPATCIVALSEDGERECVRRALEMGVKAYVSKRSSGEQLLRAIRTAAEGGIYVDPAVASAVLTSRPAAMPGGAMLDSPLTWREAEVVRLIALGYTSKEIGGQLGITVQSVATYKARACDKLKLKRRPQLVRYAVARGWIPQS